MQIARSPFSENILNGVAQKPGNGSEKGNFGQLKIYSQVTTLSSLPYENPSL